MVADPKPTPRIVDATVYALFHGTPRWCVCCGTFGVQAHHIIERDEGGDDVLANLVGLCGRCHDVYHTGGKYETGIQAHPVISSADVKRSLGRYLRVDDDAQAYLIHKVGPFGAERFVQKLEEAE